MYRLGKAQTPRGAPAVVQQFVRRKVFELSKALGKENIADLLTKHLAQDEMWKHVRELRMRSEGGRAESAPATLST